MSSEAEAFVTALDVACVVLPMILFSSTATVFYPVFWTKTATTVEIPPLPLTGMVLQCAIWLVFCGLSNIIPGIVPNAFGVAIGLVFFVLYEKSHRRKVYGRAWRRHLSGLAVMGVLVGLCAGFAVAWHGSGGGEGYAAEAIIAVFGWLGFSASVLFLAHPLVAMARVLLTNNVGAMGSVEMNVCAVVTGFAWFANAVFFLESGGLQIALANLVCVLANAAALCVRWKLRHQAEEILSEAQFEAKVRKMGPWWQWALLEAGGGEESVWVEGCGKGDEELGTVTEAAQTEEAQKTASLPVEQSNASSTAASEGVAEAAEMNHI
mmetsp:Transcript_2837/g.6544  ORF Transcript_2837/g.6544 Transcript_2837/m.6544 type:complete len:322 (+) Transcript_2837:327-1292(+)|eukprot:CAMPEP_0178986022 /NCGR_PEP_ID=MMETSP0795-20121207/2474_1 /TAXON_ID=88552 /ORGANISM="Amoebophrya sp., Strain Ameob2" /LENGTH=321 /DNA_ID=CAMNT_0020677039 /DNA_START=179 /DNA_END=1144 /DNA_ORIENTATION=-